MKNIRKFITFSFAKILLYLVGFSLIFVAGSFHEDVPLERVSEYATSVVTKRTANHDYCVLSVDAPKQSSAYYHSELSNLFDVVKTGVITYGSGMNVKKEHVIKFKDINTKSLSLFYMGPTGSEYLDSEKKTYRHHLYNLNTLFEDDTYNGTSYDKRQEPVIYISIAQANKFLGDATGSEKIIYSKNEYEELIGTSKKFVVDGKQCSFTIWNIYLFNFYTEGLKSVLGDYIVTSYYYPPECDLRNEHKSLYFFNQYTYYNKYLLKYLENRFEAEKPHAEILKNNIIDDIDENIIVSYYYEKPIVLNQWLFFAILIISMCFIASAIILGRFISKNNNRILLNLSTLIPLFIPYLVFKIIYLFTNDSLLFSEISCKINAIGIFVYVIVFVLMCLGTIDKSKTIGSSVGENSYEVVI